MQTRGKTSFAALTVVGTLLLPQLLGHLLMSAVAEQTPPDLVAALAAEPPATERRQGPVDPKEVERFIDQRMATYLPALHVPGAVAVVVKGDQTLFSKGYGFADLARQTPVRPDQTLFRVASVTKLFTATAAMQLAEEGRLDLNTDVNRYLNSVHTPSVTMANLLTHTGGFDEQIIGMAARTQDDFEPLDRHLASHMPPRVTPPSETSSYSNYGSALAGLVTQEVSGQSYESYIQQHVLDPLAMRHSSFRAPAALGPDMATGYDYDPNADAYEALPFDVLQINPAGSLSTTGADMAHFMIAHLQNGRYGDTRILQEATAQAMHRQQFTHHPKLPGFAYGFYEGRRDGLRSIEHAGGWRGFGSLLCLLPDQQVGLFVSGNRMQPWLGELLVRDFVRHFYPRVGSPVPAACSADDLSRFAGSYRLNRYDRHTLCKLSAMASEIRVEATPDGKLVARLAGVPDSRWVQVEPMLFRYDGPGEHYLAFRADASGHVAQLLVGILAADRLEWYESNAFQCKVAAAWLVTFLLTLLSTPAVRPSSTNLLGSGAALANLVFALTLPGALRRLGFGIVYGLPCSLKLLLCVPLIGSLLAVLSVLRGVRTWTQPGWSVPARLHWVAATLGSAAYLWQLGYWNLLGW